METDFLYELFKGALDSVFGLGARFDEQHGVFPGEFETLISAHFTTVL